MLFFLPIGRKGALGVFPLITVFLILLNTVIFYLTWPSEKRFMTDRVSIQRSSQLARELALILLSPRSDFPETNFYALQADLEKNDFPSLETETIFSAVQNHIIEISDEARYRWNLQYSKYTAFKQSVVISGERSSVFMEYGFYSLKNIFPNIITYQFLHAGFFHLFFNMLFLWIVGCNLEERWGPVLFLALYLCGGSAAAFVQYAASSAHNIPLIGASGAVASIMGAFLIRHALIKIRVFYFYMLVSFRYGVFEAPAWIVLPLWLLQQLFWGLTTLQIKSSSVGYWAHVGGFLFGIAVGLTIKFLKLANRWETIAERTDTALIDKQGKAYAAFGYGELDKAEKLFREILEANPVDLKSHQELLKIYEQNGDKKMILQTSAEIVKIAYDFGNNELVQKTLTLVIDTAISFPVADSSAFLFAFYCEKCERWQDAIGFYEKIINASMQSVYLPKALFSCGKLILEKLNSPEQAKLYFDKLLCSPFGNEWKTVVDDYLRQRQ